MKYLSIFALGLFLFASCDDAAKDGKEEEKKDDTEKKDEGAAEESVITLDNAIENFS